MAIVGASCTRTTGPDSDAWLPLREQGSRQWSGVYCLNVGGVQIDAAVANAFLGAVAPAGLAASLRAAELLQADHDGALAQWRLAVERADYEVQRAERRYRAVDPDNRLVARGLETQWEQCLRALEQARCEFARREQLRPQQLTQEQREHVLAMGRDLQRLWNAPSTSLRDKKELLRTLLEEVGVSVYREQYRALLKLRWRGGLLTECDVSLPRSRPAAVRTDEDTDRPGRSTARMGVAHPIPNGSDWPSWPASPAQAMSFSPGGNASPNTLRSPASSSATTSRTRAIQLGGAACDCSLPITRSRGLGRQVTHAVAAEAGQIGRRGCGAVNLLPVQCKQRAPARPRRSRPAPRHARCRKAARARRGGRRPTASRGRARRRLAGPGRGRAQALQQPVADLDLVFGRDALQRGAQAQHVVPAALDQVRRAFDETGLLAAQVEREVLQQPRLRRLVQPAGDAAPQRPPFGC